MISAVNDLNNMCTNTKGSSVVLAVRFHRLGQAILA